MSEQQRGPSPAKGLRLPAVFFNPWFGVVAGLASIVSLFLAIYFYLAAVRQPRLMFSVYAPRATVVKSGQASRLKVLHDGREISRDVTAVQVAVWNDGSKPIRYGESFGEILAEIKIVTDPRVPILEARVRKSTRSVVALDVDTARIAWGELGVRFRILEKNDGGILEVIYAGAPEQRIRVEGTVAEQGPVLEASDPFSSRLPWLTPLWAFVTLAFSTLLVEVVHGVTRVGRKTRLKRAFYVVGLVLAALFTMQMSGKLLLFVLFTLMRGGPPF